MKTSTKIWAGIGLLIIVAAAVFALSQISMLRKAHNTFDNYYAFRGCSKLIDETATYGDCQLPSGKIIKLVNFEGRWFLDGDLPSCWFNICF